MPSNNGFVLLTGTANIKLAKDVAQILGQEVDETVTVFSDGEKRVIIPENLRRRDVFIIQSTCPPSVDENIMELLLILDAAKRSSASEVSAVIPYFGYSRQDRKDRSRVPISSALVAGLIEHAGAKRIVSLDIHSEQEPGFIKIPWDILYGSYALVPELKKHFSKNLVIASPDKGGVPKATFYADLLNADGVAIVYKERDVMKRNSSRVLDMIGTVAGKDVLIVDDMIDTAGTICDAAKLLKEKGARSISVVATHGIFSGSAPEKIKTANFDKIFITDTVPIRKEILENPKVTIISVAQLIAEAIICIHKGNSLSEEELIPRTHQEERN